MRLILFVLLLSSCKPNQCTTTVKRCSGDKLQICSKGHWSTIVDCKLEADRLQLDGACATTPKPRCFMWEKDNVTKRGTR